MSLHHAIARFFSAAADAICPAVCECCGRPLVDGEKLICVSCLTLIPATGYHQQEFNELHKRLAAPGIPVERTAAWFHYIRQNPYALMLQRAKYSNRPVIMRYLGAEFAKQLKSTNFFDGIDVIIPVPLHPFKQWRRGYNQSEMIARGINSVTDIPIGDNLCAHRRASQTHKSANQRQANANLRFFSRSPQELCNKHILLVDDIITTGATLRDALRALHAAVPGKIAVSVLTLGASKLS